MSQWPSGMGRLEQEGGRAEAEGPLLVRPAQAEPVDGPAYMVEGVLTAEIENGCVWLDGYPVVWPTGTTASRPAFSVRFPDGQQASNGDHLEGGGGYYRIDSIPETSALVGLDTEKARVCLIGPTDEVAVFNNHADITVTAAGVTGAPSRAARAPQ